MEQNLCVLIDFENVAAGTEKEGHGRFDIRLVMRRLKDKGRILVARSYGDWGRFAKFKQSLLEQGVTMVELTSYRGQDKNRADIAMVVDAMELAFTRSYLDTFVILSGDSDFTPLVTRLKELNKHVVGIGTRKSTSRLLVESCDEFMFYDVLKKGEMPAPRKPVRAEREDDEDDDEDDGRETVTLTRAQAFQLLKETVEGLQRDQAEPIHASIVKASMLRKEPAFDELEYGFKVFARFLEAAQQQGLVHLSRDSGRGGGYRVELVGGAEEDEEDENSADVPSDADVEVVEDEGAAVDLPRLSKPAEKYRDILLDAGMDPLTPPMRRAVIQALVEEVKDRGSSRRLNLQAAVGAIARRTRTGSIPVPPRAVRAVLQALFKAGELIHADGNPVRSPGASFMVPKSADALLLSLQSFYLKYILEKDPADHDSGALAELILGNRADAQDIEALLAWLLYEKMEPKDRGPEEEPTAVQETSPSEPVEDAEDDETRIGQNVSAEEPAAEAAAPKRAPMRRKARRKTDKDETVADSD